MARVLALTAGVLVACLAGCSPFGSGGAFTCETAGQCNAGGGGRCEGNGLCSYLDPSCPSGQRYGDHSGNNSDVCVGQEPGGDGPSGDGPGGPACFGAADGIVKVCFAQTPSGELTLPAAINTGTSDLCTTPMSGGDGFCVIARAKITVAAGVTVAVTGPRSLVLVSNSTIEVLGTLDAASHRGPAPSYATRQIGAGAASGTACSPGTAPVTGEGAAGGGGGAGGTFGGKGGSGGKGVDDGGDNAGGAGGTADAPQLPITALRGGCAGQKGETGTPGDPGNGGGAVYLIAKTAINIAIGGAINASGEGGHPGLTGSAGAGGGGSGGMIGLDAPTISNAGVVFANGGGGGEGSGTTNPGNPGSEPTGVAIAPGGSAGTNTGGNGGDGGGPTSAPNGRNGADGTSQAGSLGGGGAGGGGTGVLKVFSGALAGQHSPNPS